MRSLIIISCLVASLLVAQVSLGQEVAKSPPPIPERTGYLTDQAQALSADQAKQLEASLQQIDRQLGATIYILLVKSTKPLEIVPYTHQVAKSWGLKIDSDRDKWLLLLVATGDGGINITDSQAMRALLPDEELGLIMEKQLKPAFNAGKFAAGLSAGLKAIFQRLALAPSSAAAGDAQSPKGAFRSELLLLGLLGLLAAALYFLVIRSR